MKTKFSGRLTGKVLATLKMPVLLGNEDKKGSDISILNFTLAFGICLEDSSVFALYLSIWACA